MNNNDYFQQAIDKGDFIEAARLAIGFGKGKGSRGGAWSWADEAKKAAEQAGVTLDCGRLSWPDFEAMSTQLNKEKQNV